MKQSLNQLAPFACFPEHSSGRLYSEAESETRSCFQRDRDRIIHSAAFRRLEYKTQVFVNHEGDHYRTRLTHTLEVSQIARTLARCLNLNEDLAEALALAHDLGHPPFGHAGEYALAELMEPFGGFDHNAQSLSVITRLERRYLNFDGLNLTWETLEGIVKHNGPLIEIEGAKPLPREIKDYNAKNDLRLASFASAEAQVAALADDIAYNNHDIDDGLRAGLFSMEDLLGLPLVGEIFQKVILAYPDVGKSRQRHEAVRELIGAMVNDCLTESQQRLKEAAPLNVDDIRGLDHPVISFSEEMHEIDRSLKDFLFENMYRHYRVNRMTSKARRVVRDLFDLLLAEPENLPTEWQQHVGGKNDEQTAHVVADYIAGMTDRFAYDEHAKLIDI
ncbi:MAG: deoxyguanosinetriphosphate triphosphohydrolase [Rhodospirillaceae bacterium]|jgi:dGTPase|nr:deoxyguanosinetriphosphate triphosphohydrolase [Rhodospirillaceae bacterium]MBT7265741.1 deoxyguanosinetriphosphate triphosphohydrolase [Rhodospirillaceae bacterium]